MTAYYNDFDPGVCNWLEELIRRGLIAPGVVDRRSILDVEPSDLRGFTQVHFFAGIGGWSRALRLARWPDDRPVWTGSPPCQPFSSAGQQKGREDERHLSPKFASLVRACRPGVLFGEQVASAEVFGKAASGARSRVESAPAWAWIDDLSDRLEAARYAVGANDFPSAGVGAPHIRQRTFFGAVELDGLADGLRTGLEGHPGHGHGSHEPGRLDADPAGPVAPGVRLGGLADAGNGAGQRGEPRATVGGLSTEAGGNIPCAAADAPDSFWANPDWLFCRDGKWRPVEPGFFEMADGLPERVGHLRVECAGEGQDGASEKTRSSEELQDLRNGDVQAAFQRETGRPVGVQEARVLRPNLHGGGLRGHHKGDERQEQSTPVSEDPNVLLRNLRGQSPACAPQRREPAEQLTGQPSEPLRFLSQEGTPPEACFPLAIGVRHRVPLLRGYGNAINPVAAAEFIKAFDASIRHLRLTAVSEMTNDTGDIFE